MIRSENTLPVAASIEANAIAPNDRITLIYKLHIDFSPRGYSAVAVVSPAADPDEKAYPCANDLIDNDIVPLGRSRSLQGIFGARGIVTALTGDGERIDLVYDESDRLISRIHRTSGKTMLTVNFTYDDKGRVLSSTRVAGNSSERISVRYAAIDAVPYREMTRQYIPLPMPWHACDAPETITSGAEASKSITSLRYNGLKAEAITVDASGKEKASVYYTFDATGVIIEQKSYLTDAEYLAVSTAAAGKTVKTEHYRNGAMTHYVTMAYAGGDRTLERVCTPEGRPIIERRFVITRR
ncbi:MAG: hypothetical protein AABZ39_12455 [Spirochaetota bacterium]